MIVDDNQSDIDLVRIVFELNGPPVHIESVSQSDQAVAILHEAVAQHRGPDLIILDLHMPRMDGYEVIVAMKSDGLIEDIPVVMLSSSFQLRDEQRCVYAGARALYPKPGNLDELIILADHLRSYLKNETV